MEEWFLPNHKIMELKVGRSANDDMSIPSMVILPDEDEKILNGDCDTKVQIVAWKSRRNVLDTKDRLKRDEEFIKMVYLFTPPRFLAYQCTDECR